LQLNKHIIWEYVEKLEPRFHALADQVWSTPETCYGEHRSMEAHSVELLHHGFRVKQGIAGIPTALIAEAGTKGPVIAFLGEYDALAGLSQQSDIFEEKPIEKNGNGHGCGHNLLGSAAMQAATSLKNWMTETGTEGIIRYYGCPAEEGGAAKTFMVREKVFEDVDIAITWHPGSLTGVVRGSSLANCRVDFLFEGRASHAAGAPHLGRSALDAIELMNVGVNYMREHMPDKARIHYAIIDGGGISPNVVQSKGRVRYVVRDENTSKMLELLERVKKIARGAAMMTETKVKIKMLAGVSNLLYNATLGEVMHRNLDLLGPPVFTDKERQYAKKMQSTMSFNDIETAYIQAGISEVKDQVLAESILPSDAQPVGMSGSTDVADVSWVVPTVQLWGANYAIGTPFHSWQMTAQGKSSIAIKGMTHAATAMAATGVDILLDKKLRENAWLDLKKSVGKKGYVSPLLNNAKPPIKDMAP